MRSVVIALLFVAAFTSSVHYEGLWTQWKTQYGRSYQPAEEVIRFAIFSENVNIVNKWNAENEETDGAVLGLNQFADLTPEEFGAIYTGALPAPQEVVEENTVVLPTEGTVPTSWNWVNQGAVTPIKNQQQCGSCWAFATVATTEGLYEINGNTLTSFSEQQIVSCDKTCAGCNGGWPYLAMAYVAANGLETETQYPYIAQTGTCKYNKADAITTGVTGAAFVTPKSPTALFAAVYQQPTAIIVEADQSVFQLYTSGIIGAGCGVALDHAITAVGYTPTYFIVKNSWGTSWGQEGYLWISTSTSYNSGLGACGIFSQPQYPKGLNASTKN
jgi:C1A family cysteine protease